MITVELALLLAVFAWLWSTYFSDRRALQGSAPWDALDSLSFMTSTGGGSSGAKKAPKRKPAARNERLRDAEWTAIWHFVRSYYLLWGDLDPDTATDRAMHSIFNDRKILIAPGEDRLWVAVTRAKSMVEESFRGKRSVAKAQLRRLRGAGYELEMDAFGEWIARVPGMSVSFPAWCAVAKLRLQQEQE